MPNNLQIFENPEFGKVRIIMQGEEPWFVAKDVCDALELTNSRATIALLEEDERGVNTIYTPSGEQEMSIISEPGLYSLVLRSRKPEAKKFKRWVTHDVLPTIRKHGMYATDDYLDKLAKDPMALYQTLGALIEERGRRQALEAENAELKDTLGDGENYKSAKSIKGLERYFDIRNRGFWTSLGKRLKKLSVDMGYDTRLVPSMEYGNIYGYNIEVINAFMAMVENDVAIMSRYRISD